MERERAQWHILLEQMVMMIMIIISVIINFLHFSSSYYETKFIITFSLAFIRIFVVNNLKVTAQLIYLSASLFFVYSSLG